jgi:hypothetical protein
MQFVVGKVALASIIPYCFFYHQCYLILEVDDVFK